jgi:hypothetical protein
VRALGSPDFRYGLDTKPFEWTDELTKDCPRKQARNEFDPCGAMCPDLPKVVSPTLCPNTGAKPLIGHGASFLGSRSVSHAVVRQSVKIHPRPITVALNEPTGLQLRPSAKPVLTNFRLWRNVVMH